MKKKQRNKPPDPLYRVKSCTGKKRYRSESEAMAMISTQQEYGEEMHEIRPYRCDFCKQWHLGHRIPQDDRQGDIQ
jgi:hypothetical protein